MPDQTGIDKSTVQGRATLLSIAEFREASTDFSDNATELMAATVRMQMLILDDARLTLSEVADCLSVVARNRRASDDTFG